MLISLVLVVFGASIAIFFADEWARLFARIWRIPGSRLLLPLAVVSWLIEKYEDWGHWFLIWCQARIQWFEHQIQALLPFQVGSSHLIRITSLFLSATMPVWFFHYLAKRQGPFMQSNAYRLGVAIWVVMALILTVQAH
jgi:hypothetical protein